MGEKREKFYTISARLVFSSIIVVLIVALILGLSVVINNGPIIPLLGVIQIGNQYTSSTTLPTTTVGSLGSQGSIPVNVICNPNAPVFGCINPVFNTTTGIFTVALEQTSGYNWTLVTVEFVKPGADYSESGVPILSWSPPEAVNVTNGLLNGTIRYVNIPITSGPVTQGTNITGTIWAKYQLGAGKAQFYANMSSAFIAVK